MFYLLHGFAFFITFNFEAFKTLSINYLRCTVKKAAVNDDNKSV